MRTHLDGGSRFVTQRRKSRGGYLHLWVVVAALWTCSVKLSQARWPAITEQNDARILEQNDAVREYLEMDMDEGATRNGYLAMVEREGGFRRGGGRE